MKFTIQTLTSSWASLKKESHRFEGSKRSAIAHARFVRGGTNVMAVTVKLGRKFVARL